jgi:hypothetical protein
MVKDSPIDLEPPAKEGKQVVVRKKGTQMPSATNIKKLTVLFLLTMGLAACGQTPGSPATAGGFHPARGEMFIA